MKNLLFASIFVAIAVFALSWGGSSQVASAQETEANQCYYIWFDVEPGPGKKCVRAECCEPECELIDPTCDDI
jgi:hypothetical protein